jgi:hypothetical protein
MQTSKAEQNFRSDDPVWVLLAELSLGDFLSDHDRSEEPTAGFLFQTAQELDISPECMENMARTLAGIPWTDPNILPEKDDRRCKFGESLFRGAYNWRMGIFHD